MKTKLTLSMTIPVPIGNQCKIKKTLAAVLKINLIGRHENISSLESYAQLRNCDTANGMEQINYRETFKNY
uniref:Uncharacterized protein n=1 Tax=Arundo donax TaxID=35708 RepID=A0A0A9DT83_ARUDO